MIQDHSYRKKKDSLHQESTSTGKVGSIIHTERQKKSSIGRISEKGNSDLVNERVLGQKTLN
eukprot:CAMPEP_0170565338 /NCGR_PEP_ID=MMETSP0211-20121228/78256_1 /TAXON_ID=311385 /ORGANISM="Pseudokeronopsis sp., Strain OXSARD2" /LENGTH=61 /DNA_ID=CAMNT_0010886021 /DNA_START=564 /DNA_END=746 /DNA_ORIENTATION=+